jgi:hypothetical protein
VGTVCADGRLRFFGERVDPDHLVKKKTSLSRNTNVKSSICSLPQVLCRSKPTHRRIGLGSPIYMPSDQIVLSVNASFAIRKDTEYTDKNFELLFDSSAQPLPPGARAAAVSSRQLLYRIGSVYIDMEVGLDAGAERALVGGQVLDSSRPGHPVAGIPVTLIDRGQNIAQTLSNDNGEFRLVFDNRSNSRLTVALGLKNPFRLPITSTHLHEVPGKKRRANLRAGIKHAKHVTAG